MRIRSLAIAAMVALLPVTAVAAPPIEGRWKTEDGKAVVDIARCGDGLCGHVVRVLAPTPKGPPVDSNNPDPRLRHRPILGLEVLSGFHADDDEWRGRIYSPEEGKSYRSILQRTGADTLKVRGCIAIFCKTQTWTRVG